MTLINDQLSQLIIQAVTQSRLNLKTKNAKLD